MRWIDVLRILALSSVLILAIGGTSGASEEESGDTGEPSSVEASEGEADDTSSTAEESDTEASEAEAE